jgi:hypothetical protein
VENVKDGITDAFQGAGKVAGKGIKGVVDATGGLVAAAAKLTPGLKEVVGTYVHT